MWLRIEFIPRLQPCAERIFVHPLSVKHLRIGNRSGELLFHFCLCLAENALDDSFTVFFIVSSGISPFPSPILALSNIALAVCPFLCHVRASFVLVAQTTTTEGAQSLLIFSKDRNIFYPLSRASKIPILCLLRRSFCVCQLHFSLPYPSLPSTPNVRKTVCA